MDTTESGLVARARGGDRYAFDELVLRHRAKLLGYTRTMVRDSHAAEDIVQEALLKGFSKLRQLQDDSRFGTWLRRIVRNEALMRLRSAGATVRTEQPESDCESLAAAVSPDGDPASAMQAALVRTLMDEALEELSARERAVFEAHCLAGLSADETAGALGMKKGAVYTQLSRARSKLEDGRYRREAEQLASARARRGCDSVRQLPRIALHRACASLNSIVTMILQTLYYIGDRRFTLPEAMAVTGHAFRLAAAADLGPGGFYGYDWRRTVRASWEALGYGCRIASARLTGASGPAEQAEALGLIQESIDRGIPVLGWHLSAASFGLIYGYDDAEKALRVIDTSVFDGKLPYERLGRRTEYSELFVAAITQRLKPRPERDESTGILAGIADHLSGRDKAGGSGCLSGLCAYEAWLGPIDKPLASHPYFVAMNAEAAAEARKHAAWYMRRLNGQAALQGWSGEAAALMTCLADSYEAVASHWRSAAWQLSAGRTYGAVDVDARRRAQEHLREAFTLETGIAAAASKLAEIGAKRRENGKM